MGHFAKIINSFISLKRYWTRATTSCFHFVKWNTFQKYDFYKKQQVKAKSKSKVMPVFVFYLWRNLWQTFRTSVNFLYNFSVSRDTRSLIWGQVFNQSLWKLVQTENTCFKTLQLQNFCKMLGKRCKTGIPL